MRVGYLTDANLRVQSFSVYMYDSEASFHTLGESHGASVATLCTFATSIHFK